MAVVLGASVIDLKRYKFIVIEMTQTKQITIAGSEFSVSGEGHFFEHLPEGALVDPNIEALRRIIRFGDTVYDIGANVGLVTLGIADLAGQVIAVEPSEATFNHLRRNTAHLPNVTCVRSLIGANGRSFIENSADPTGSTSAPAGITFDHSHLRVVDVPTLSLDALVRAYGRADVIKIDVEGAEMSVLSSGAETLRSKPTVMLEFNALCLMAFGRANPADVISELRSIFPHVSCVLPGGLHPVTDDFSFLCDNVLKHGCVDDLVCSFKDPL